MSRSLEKYWDLFPTILFKSPDVKHSMHFILSLKHMTDDQKQSLVELWHHCGADLSFKLEDVKSHSAVIVDHNDIVNVRAPAFTITYVYDCLRELKVQNIADYRQDVTKHIVSDDKCMDVVYYRKLCWRTVLSAADKQWFDLYIPSGVCVDFPDPQSDTNCVSNAATQRSFSDEFLSETSDDDDDDVHLLNEKEKREGKNKKMNLRKKGETRSTEKTEEISHRSQSKNQISHSANKITSSLSDTENKATSNSSRKWSFLDKFLPESSDDDVHLLEEGEKLPLLDEIIPESSEEDVHPPKKEDKRHFFDFDGDNKKLFPASKDKKHSRMPYSYDEQSKILKYIMEHDEYSRIKGRDLWMIMERRKVCPNRTWQSMKEHYLKKIVFSLESFDFLTEIDKRKIKSHCT